MRRSKFAREALGIALAGLMIAAPMVANAAPIRAASNDEEPANGWVVEHGVLVQTIANEDSAPWGDRVAVVGELNDFSATRTVSAIVQFNDYAGTNGVWTGISLSHSSEFPDHTVSLILERADDDMVRGGLLLINGQEAGRQAFPWSIRQPIALRVELDEGGAFVAGLFMDAATGDELLRLQGDGLAAPFSSTQPATVFAACSAQYGYGTNPAVSFAAFAGLDSLEIDAGLAEPDGALDRLDYATARYLERKHFSRPLIEQQENAEYVLRLTGMADWAEDFAVNHPRTQIAQRARTWKDRANQLETRTAPADLLSRTREWGVLTQEMAESPWREEYTRKMWQVHPHDLATSEGTEAFLQDLYALAADESLAPYVRTDIVYHSAVRAYRAGEHTVADEIAQLILSDFRDEGFRTHARMTRLDVMMRAHDLEGMIAVCEAIRQDPKSTREDLMVADLYEGTLLLYFAPNSDQIDLTFEFLQPVLDRFETFHAPTEVAQEAAFWALRRGMMACLKGGTGKSHSTIQDKSIWKDFNLRRIVQELNTCATCSRMPRKLDSTSVGIFKCEPPLSSSAVRQIRHAWAFCWRRDSNEDFPQVFLNSASFVVVSSGLACDRDGKS